MKKQLIGGVLLLMVSTFALAQQNFTTPGQATDALTKAISEQNEEALNSLLGDNWRDYLPPEGVDPEAVARFLRDWKVSHHVAINGNTAHLYVGENGWQLPIPVVKKPTAGSLICKKPPTRSRRVKSGAMSLRQLKPYTPMWTRNRAILR